MANLLRFRWRQVRAFEDLELEVDGAVLRAGRQMLREEERLNGRGSVRDNNASSFSLPGLVGVREALPGDGSQEKGVAGAEQDISGRNVVGVTAGFPLEEAMSLPIAPHRRLRQAVLLAQKLLRKEAELEATRRELTEVEERWVLADGQGGGKRKSASCRVGTVLEISSGGALELHVFRPRGSVVGLGVKNDQTVSRFYPTRPIAFIRLRDIYFTLALLLGMAELFVRRGLRRLHA